MSQENVDRLRRAFEAWSRGDRQTVEALLRDFLAPGFEMHPLYLDEVYRGVEGLWAMWAAARATWEDYRFELEEILDLDDDALVMGPRLDRGAASGVPISQPLGMLFTFRDDKAVRAKSFTSKQEALEAVGVGGLGDVAGVRGGGSCSVGGPQARSW
jgi:ketosteroid isomerase-like protein